MLSRQKSYKGNKPILREMAALYGKPKDFSSFLTLSQYVQKEAMTIAIAAHRLKSPFCMGTMYWQLNDCWAGPSWSTIGFDGAWKPAHYALQRLYAPLLMVLNAENDSIKVNIVSDNVAMPCNLQVRLKDMSGKIMADYQHVIDLKKGSGSYLAIPQNALMGDIDPSQHFLEVVLHAGRKVLATEFLYFGPPHQLELSDPDFSYQVDKIQGGFTVKLEAHNLIKDMEIQIVDLEARPSDNYFDLAPGQTKWITITTNEIETEKELLKRLRFRDLRRLLE